jgi:DNA-binding FrmR family transcriptional regulator
MEAEAKANLLYRLSCIEGHLRAVKRMVDEDRPCPEVVQQTRALQGSLRQVSILLVTNHLDHCLRADAAEGQDAARQQMRNELVALFQLESA